MRDLLFIKTSSLGDVIHHMPALTEARHWRPELDVAWMVEENFAPLVALHRGVEVIPVAMRRWRRNWWRPSTYHEVWKLLRTLRRRQWDVIIDTQGLFFKSGLMALLARGERHGYDRHSIRDAFSSFAYDVKHPVGKGLHAVARNRLLTSMALGYRSQGPIDYGLDRNRICPPVARPYVVLLHASAREEKLWPEENWIALGRQLASRGLELMLPAGNDVEQARAERIAAALPEAQVPPRMGLDRMARVIAGATFVVGVDTGLLHLAAALGVPVTAIFIGSEPGLTGPMGEGPITIVGGKNQMPSVADVSYAVDIVMR